MKRSGFTLLELMLALSIVSISLVVVINSFSIIVRAKTSVANHTKAMFLAEQKLFDLKIEKKEERKTEGIFDAPLDNFHWLVETESALFEGLEKISLSVSWKEHNHNKKIRTTTYLKRG
ncbi:MAG: type II secretion system protein [PVC group bacterium]|nr:type II secretion system protein [PVC group bacterium]